MFKQQLTLDCHVFLYCGDFVTVTSCYNMERRLLSPLHQNYCDVVVLNLLQTGDVLAQDVEFDINN